MINRISLLLLVVALSIIACEKKASDNSDIKISTDNTPSAGLKIAYVNGDSIHFNFKEFRTQSEAMDVKKRKAEEDLQKKLTALEREFYAYQQQAQKGTMTGKEMEAREKYLSGKQESLMAERDKAAKEIIEETNEINERLQKVIEDILKDIKDKEGYDFILSYVTGGPILIADEKYDITERVLIELNKNAMEIDTAKLR